MQKCNMFIKKLYFKLLVIVLHKIYSYFDVLLKYNKYYRNKKLRN
jgi:hypothetical protein